MATGINTCNSRDWSDKHTKTIEFCLNGEFCRILENHKKSSGKLLPPVGIEPRASGFHALHATVWANSLFAGSLRPLDPHIVILYWFLDLENFLDLDNFLGSIEHDYIRI